MSAKKQDEPPDPIDLLALVALAIAVTITALIVFVIIVGLIQKTLNPTAVATMLCGVLTTIVGALFTARRKDKDE